MGILEHWFCLWSQLQPGNPQADSSSHLQASGHMWYLLFSPTFLFKDAGDNCMEKTWEKLKSGRAAAKILQAKILQAKILQLQKYSNLQQFTQSSVPVSLCCHSLSPSTSQGSPPPLLLQLLVLIFLPHLSLSSSSLLLLTDFCTISLPPAHPFLPQTNPYHKCLEKPTCCDFLSSESQASLYYPPSHVWVYIKCKSFAMGAIYPFMAMPCLVK